MTDNTDFTPDNASLAPAVVALMRELWVVTDRLYRVEALLERHGIPIGAEIDSLAADTAFQAEMNAKCKALLKAVLKDTGALS